jgi:exosortase
MKTTMRTDAVRIERAATSTETDKMPAAATHPSPNRRKDTSGAFSTLRARLPTSVWPLIAAASIILVWAYWPSLSHLMGRWAREAEYSHGYFVLPVALAMLWHRRGMLTGATWAGNWWGFGFVAIGLALRFISVHEFYILIGPIALLPTLAGVALLAGGWNCLRWALPSIAFLIFMIPLPGFISERMAGPLQTVATASATYLLQLFGIPAAAQGNVIELSTPPAIAVVEACSGLRMLTLFFAVSTAVAVFINRNVLEKIIIIASAVPIALAVNILRLTATGMIHEWAGPEISNRFFHDFAGYLMGPAALVFLWLELKFFDRAVVVVPEGPLVPGVLAKAGK